LFTRHTPLKQPGNGQERLNVKLLLRSAMIFFGTLMAAGLVALGEPGAARVEVAALHETATLHALNRVVDFARPWVDMAPAQPAR
jgi:hypothetical protein